MSTGLVDIVKFYEVFKSVYSAVRDKVGPETRIYPLYPLRDAIKLIRPVRGARRAYFLWITAQEILPFVHDLFTTALQHNGNVTLRMLFAGVDNPIFSLRQRYGHEIGNRVLSKEEWKPILAQSIPILTEFCKQFGFHIGDQIKQYDTLMPYAVFALFEDRGGKHISYFVYCPPWVKQDDLRLIVSTNDRFYQCLHTEFDRFWSDGEGT